MDKFSHCLDVLSKLAELAPDPIKPSPPDPQMPPGRALSLAKTLGVGTLGLGAGYLAGAGLGKGIEYVMGQQGENPASAARVIAPVAGAAAGIIYPLWKEREQQVLRQAVEKRHAYESARNQNRGRLPG
jgi:hypothetical protein